jgi:hypothetical protein
VQQQIEALAFDRAHGYTELAFFEAEPRADQEIEVFPFSPVVLLFPRRGVVKSPAPVEGACDLLDLGGAHTGGIHAANHRPHAGASDRVHLDVVLFEVLDHPDVR